MWSRGSCPKVNLEWKKCRPKVNLMQYRIAGRVMKL
jgi:hypothetical protein